MTSTNKNFTHTLTSAHSNSTEASSASLNNERAHETLGNRSEAEQLSEITMQKADKKTLIGQYSAVIILGLITGVSWAIGREFYHTNGEMHFFFAGLWLHAALFSLIAIVVLWCAST